MTEPEQFLIRTVGGPHPGNRLVSSTQYEWPLPGTLGDEGGFYYKVSESELPPMEAGSRVIRGAQYYWQEQEKRQ